MEFVFVSKQPEIISEMGRKHNTSIALLQDQLRKGQGIEMKTIDDRDEAKRVAFANLSKSASYYLRMTG